MKSLRIRIPTVVISRCSPFRIQKSSKGSFQTKSLLNSRRNYWNYSNKNAYKAFETIPVAVAVPIIQEANFAKILFVPFGLLGLVAAFFGASASGEEKEQTIEEPRTHTRFSKKINIENSLSYIRSGLISLLGGNFEVTGVAVRTISFLRFNAYAVGLYVHPEDKKKVKESQDPEKIFSSILANEIDGVIRVIPTRHVQLGHLMRGFANAMGNVLKKELGVDDQTTLKLQETFEKLVPFSKDIPTNAHLDFVVKKDGSLTIYNEGQAIGNLQSKQTCIAFITVYLGKNTKLDLRKQVIESFKSS